MTPFEGKQGGWAWVWLLAATTPGLAACSSSDGALSMPASDGAAGFDASGDATESDSPSVGDRDATTGDSPTESDASEGGSDPCSPSAPYDLGKCSYSVDLPCGATYPSEDCRLLLTDCVNVCANGSITCQYAATACDDSGTVTVPPPALVTVLCNDSTSKVCPQ